MSTEEELEKKEDDASEGPPGEEETSAPSARPTGKGSLATTQDAAPVQASDAEEEDEDDDEGDERPVVQLGSNRFVYAAYFGGAIAIAFLLSKLIDFGWLRLSQWQPTVGEPQEELVMVLSGLIGAGAALYYWKRTRTRQLIEEVADELSKVTWPSKQEVTNGTAVVLVTTALATIFFALMDRFWGFVTNLVYGS